MSGAHLSLIYYSRLYLVQGLVITATHICVTLSHQVCQSMTSSLKISNQFSLFSIFQHTPTGSGCVDSNPPFAWIDCFGSSPLTVHVWVNCLGSSPLYVWPFFKSSFCAISSLTFCTSAIFSLFYIPMMRSLNSEIFFPWGGLVMKSSIILSVW